MEFLRDEDGWMHGLAFEANYNVIHLSGGLAELFGGAR